MVIKKSLKKHGNLGLRALALASTLVFSACAAEGESEADLAAGEEEPEVAAAVSEATDPGANQPGKVATIGDSWMANTLGTGNAITGALRRAGHPYTNYAVQGTMLLKNNIFGQSVINQARRAVATKRFKTIVMTGGGNDIIENATLQRDCARTPIGPDCTKKLKDIGDAMVQLWDAMGDNGIEDVVYVSYANAAGNAAGANIASAERLKVACAEATKIRCHYVDTNPFVPNKGALLLDGIHPRRPINDQIAAEVYRVMEAEQTYR